MRPSLHRFLAALVAVTVLGSGCGDDGDTNDPRVITGGGLVFPLCQDPEFESEYSEAERMRVCAAWHEGTRAGGLAGTEAARRAVDEATADGYALRATTAVGLAGLAGTLAGLLLGTLAAWAVRTRRRRETGYAELAVAAIDTELRALRALAVGDALAAHIAERLAAPMARLEAHGCRLAQRCRDARGTEKASDAAGSAHVQGLHDQLDKLLARVERLRVRTTVWIEAQAGDAEDDPTGLDTALDGAIEDLGAGLSEADA